MKYQLHVRVIEADDIPKMDANATDAYCILTVGSTKFNTKVIDNEMHPVWNEEFHFPVPDPSTGSLHIIMKDKDIFKDDDISTLEKPFSALQIDQVVDEWYNMVPCKKVKKGGKLHLVLHMAPEGATPFQGSTRSATPSKVLPIFTDNQLITFQSVFDHYDKSKQGIMEIKDLGKALKTLGITINNEDFNQITTYLSQVVENYEQFDLPLFVSIIYYFLKGADTQKDLLRAFSAYDTDHDGKMPINEITEILLSLKHPFPSQKIEELCQQFKDDQDLVDYKALIKALRP